MNAKYLTIAGHKIQKGGKYYTVHIDTGELAECTAHNENNVTYNCYFKHEHEAVRFSQSVKLANVLHLFIREIAEKHRGK